MLDNSSKKLVEYLTQKRKGVPDKEILKTAQKNRTLYYLASECNLNDIKTVGDDWIEKLQKTLKYIEKNLNGKIDYSVTRTFKYIPYVTFDVDLLVDTDDFIRASEIFKKAGSEILSHDSSLGGRIAGQQLNVITEGLLTIDLHRDFTWQERRFLDANLVLKNQRRRSIAKRDVPVPSAEIELLLCLSDVAHERFNLTLLDIIWLGGLSKEIKDWNFIFNQVSKYSWQRTFLLICQRVNQMSLDIYGKEIIPKINHIKGLYTLPYFIPLWICWLSYIENFLKNKKLPLISLAYMHYTKIRYYLSGKKRMPYYDDWVKL